MSKNIIIVVLFIGLMVGWSGSLKTQKELDKQNFVHAKELSACEAWIVYLENGGTANR